MRCMATLMPHELNTNSMPSQVSAQKIHPSPESKKKKKQNDEYTKVFGRPTKIDFEQRRDL